MNCTTPTRQPWPSARNASPQAAVDFPLPGPVWTISRPPSLVLDATSASCTAFRFSIFALWRDSSSCGILGSLIFQYHRQAGGHKHHAVRDGGDGLVERGRRLSAELSLPARCQARYRGPTSFETNTIGAGGSRAAASKRSGFRPPDQPASMTFVSQSVRQSTSNWPGFSFLGSAGQVSTRRFDGVPAFAASRLMMRDPLPHFVVEAPGPSRNRPTGGGSA